MNRLSINQADVDRHRSALVGQFPNAQKPCPGTVLKLDDDVSWMGFIKGRVVWGHDDPAQLHLYAPDIFGDFVPPLDVGYVDDRAPVDPGEAPLPILAPVEQQQEQAQDEGDDAGARQMGGVAVRKTRPKLDPKKVIQAVLKALPPENAKFARERIRALRPDLLTGDKDQG